MIDFEFLEIVLFDDRYQVNQKFRSKLTLKQQVWMIEQLQGKDVEVLFVDDEGFNVLDMDCHDVDHGIGEDRNVVLCLLWEFFICMFHDEYIHWVLLNLIED